jgi:hypothetical protein
MKKNSLQLKLQQKLDEAADQSSASPSKELEDQFSKLKQDADKKDIKITSLTKVIQNVISFVKFNCKQPKY